MKIRSTEREHRFTEKLFNHLRLFSLQGLTIDVNHNFTAAIEAVQYHKDERIDLSSVFPFIEVKAKYFLAKSLNVPLYFITHQHSTFKVYHIVCDNEFTSKLVYTFNEKEFVNWWATLKGLSQPKPLMEAAERVKDSVFDITLVKYGMAWGGNIDGYMFKNKKYACIIENIYTQRHPLESHKGEPSYYFHMRGPNYNTWYPTVKLAGQLNIPLFVFTIEGNSKKERIGFSVIDYLSTKGIFYKGKKPNQNILEGLQNIKNVVEVHLNSSPPKIV